MTWNGALHCVWEWGTVAWMIFYSDLVSMLILSSLCRFFLSAAYRDIKDSQQTVKDII